MCSGSEKITDEIAKERCIIMRGHEGKYDYTNLKFHTEGSTIDIVCLKHGEFSTNMYAHIKGVECYKCYDEIRSYFLAEAIQRSLLLKQRLYMVINMITLKTNYTKVHMKRL